jgi:hypothetical protein
MNLVLAVKAAAEGFHDAWFPRLGLDHKAGVGKEHWTRVKALSRRLATGMADCYDSLQPVADLCKELQDRIYVFVQNPVKWKGAEPTDDEKQVVFDTFADAIARRMLKLATQRVCGGTEAGSGKMLTTSEGRDRVTSAPTSSARKSWTPPLLYPT